MLVVYGQQSPRVNQQPEPGEAVANRIRTLAASGAPGATILIRVLVGAAFLSEGIQKFLFPEALGVGRFAKIGIPSPTFTAPFVGVVEIFFGFLLILGLMTRLASITLIIDISVALATTKVPMLLEKGFWAAAHEARTDFSMLLGLVFLLIVGAVSVIERGGKLNGRTRIAAHLAP